MNITEFRIKHSELIECYQQIEFALKGICASISEKNWFESLEEVSDDNMGLLLKQIQQYENDYNLSYIDKKGFEILHAIRKERNYWCHKCYMDDRGFVVKEDGTLKGNSEQIANRLSDVLNETRPLVEELFKLDREILKQDSPFCP